MAWLLAGAMPYGVAAQQAAPDAQAATPAPAGPSAACRADPLAGRPLYLRGSFNGWTTEDSRRFTWFCDHYTLVTRLVGEHRYKVADEGWSADADFGRPASSHAAGDGALALRGGEFTRRFDGTYRLTVTMPPAAAPRLAIADCPYPPPLGDTLLFLRGTMNNWTALDDQAFTFSCDAYYLNVKLAGRHEFKIADAGWLPASTISDGGANFVHSFDGEHTLRLAWDGNRPRLSVGPRSYADPRTPPVTDPVALSLRFDSRAALHKQPFGAVPAGSLVQFAVQAAPGVESLTLVVEQRRLEGNQEVLAYTEQARVAMQREAGPGGVERFSARHRFDTVAVHGYWFEARIGGRSYALQNNIDPVAWTREKGAGGVATVAALPAATGAVRRFRLSVYRPDFRVPDWAGDAVYYYLFPERFRNGDKTNDPRPGGRRYQNHDIEAHARWLEPPWRPGSGDGSDAAHNNDFFGGDLAGLIDKLDHLQALGFNAIYTTPLFLAASNHKYDHADYHRIDPAFGSQADFERLTREAARRGMRLVIDASLNHTGSDSIYFDRYGNFGGREGRSQGALANGRFNPASPYAHWYRIDSTQTDPDKKYRGWVGVADLPELDKAAPGWRDFAFGAPDSVTRRWLRAGAGGWRMDVAPWVPDDFWREWRGAVKATKPDAVTIAETWFDPAKHLLGDMFDSTMNYIFRNAVLAWAAGGPASALAQQLEHLREQVPPPAHGALMNLLSSHDVPRALHVLGDHGPGTPAQAAVAAHQRFRLATLLQLSYPGAPAVYYGDEVGMTGGEDPYNRAPYPWPDEGGQPDLALQAEFTRLIALRHAQPVLRRGTLQAPLLADDAVLVLARQWGPEPGSGGPDSTARWAITAFNNATAPRTVTVTLPPGFPDGTYADAAAASASSAAPTASARGGRLTLTLPALSGQWWLAR